MNDWPTCAFSVSKMAVNTFTRLLQKELDEQGKSDIIVNAVYPGTHHSETPAFEDEFKRHKDEDGAWYVVKNQMTFHNITLCWLVTRIRIEYD